MLFIFLVSSALGNDRKIFTAPVTIEVGDTLRITPGAELLFTDTIGITVKGHLQAIGTKELPIAFASVADTTENGGTPFDWHGIEITATGSAELAYSLITNATTGITAESAHSLTLEKCIFKNNGQWNLSIAGDMQDVPEGEPYTYTAPVIPTPEELAAAAALDATAAPTSGKPPRDTKRTWRRALYGAGAAAAIGGGVSFLIAHKAQRDYDAYVPGNSEFDTATPQERQKHFEQLHRDNTTAQVIGWSLLGIAAGDIIYLKFFF